MTLDMTEAMDEYTDALKTEDRVRTLTGFYRGEDTDSIEEDVGVSEHTVESYVDTFDELGYLDRESGEVTELGEYVTDMAEQYSADDIASLFSAVRDDVGADVLDQVMEEDTVSMSEIARDHDVAPQTATNRYESLEEAGFAQSSRKRRWKTYDLTEKGEDAVEHLETFSEMVDEYGDVDTLDRLAEEVGTVTEEQHDVSHDRVVEGEFEPDQDRFGYEGWDEGQ